MTARTWLVPLQSVLRLWHIPLTTACSGNKVEGPKPAEIWQSRTGALEPTPHSPSPAWVQVVAVSKGVTVSWAWLKLAGTASGTKHAGALAASAPYMFPLQFVLVCQLQDEHHVSVSFASACFAEVELWIMSECTAHHDVHMNM